MLWWIYHGNDGNPGASALDILEQYTILTIGDGLVSQIPALLISFATGIIVTRAASEDDLSDEIISQLFSNPKVLYATEGMFSNDIHHRTFLYDNCIYPITVSR